MESTDDPLPRRSSSSEVGDQPKDAAAPELDKEESEGLNIVMRDQDETASVAREPEILELGGQGSNSVETFDAPRAASLDSDGVLGGDMEVSGAGEATSEPEVPVTVDTGSGDPVTSPSPPTSSAVENAPVKGTGALNSSLMANQQLDNDLVTGGLKRRAPLAPLAPLAPPAPPALHGPPAPPAALAPLAPTVPIADGTSDPGTDPTTTVDSRRPSGLQSVSAFGLRQESVRSVRSSRGSLAHRPISTAQGTGDQPEFDAPTDMPAAVGIDAELATAAEAVEDDVTSDAGAGSVRDSGVQDPEAAGEQATARSSGPAPDDSEPTALLTRLASASSGGAQSDAGAASVRESGALNTTGASTSSRVSGAPGLEVSIVGEVRAAELLPPPEAALKDAMDRALRIAHDRQVALPSPTDEDAEDARDKALKEMDEGRLSKGVSLSILLELIDRVKAYSLDVETATFLDVYTKVILPDIQADALYPSKVDMNYVELVANIPGANLVGPPHFYVSHAWGTVFESTILDVQNYVQMTMADQFEQDPSDPDGWQDKVFVWIDVLCRTPNRTAAETVQEVRHAIAVASKETLQCIDDDCDVHQLAWLQYEAWCTAQIKGAAKLRLLCPQVLTTGHVKRNMAKIDPETARCLQHNQHNAIVKDLRDRRALQGFRPVFTLTLLQAACAEAREWAGREGYEAYYACALHKCGVFLQACYPELLLADAEKLHNFASEIMDKSVGKHPDGMVKGLAAASSIGVAEVLLSKRDWEKAELQFKKALEQQIDAMGAEHPDTLRAKRLLAQAIKRQKRYEEAEDIYRALLPAYQRVYTERSTNFAIGLLQLAVLLSKRGQLVESRQLAEKALVESRQLAEKALGINQALLGSEHMATRQTLLFLKQVTRRQGDRGAWERYKTLLKDSGGLP